MLTLQKIKELSKLTTSSKVIKAALNLNDDTIRYVERLYDKEMFNASDADIMAKENIDIIAEAYINQRLLNDKTCIEKLLASESFKKKATTMIAEELKKYIKLCDDYAIHEILTNDGIIKNYSPKDHFELIQTFDNISTKNAIIVEFFKKAVQVILPVSYIKDLVVVLEQSLNRENSGEIVILINSPEFYKLPLITMKAVLRKLYCTEHKDQRLNLVKIISKGIWQEKNKWTFEELYELTLILTSYSQGLLEKESIYEYDYNQIVNIVQLVNTNNHLATLFKNEMITSQLSFEDIIELIDIYDLRHTANFDAFVSAISKVIEKGINISFYDDICEELDRDIYQSTITDYLDTCESIEDFIKTLEEEYKDTDPVDPNAILALSNPE